MLPRTPERRRRLPRWARILLILLVPLLLARALLPMALETWIDRGLRDLAGYRAEVGDIDLRLLRGGYTLRDVSLRKRDGSVAEPLFSADRITASLNWRGFLSHPLTADLDVAGARVHLQRGVDTAHSQLGIDLPWQELFRRMSLVRIGAFRMADGEVRFRDLRARPDVDLRARQVDMTVDNLVRGHGAGGTDHETAVHAGGRAPRRGSFVLRIRLDPEARRPEFRMDFSLDSLDLGRTGGALEAYAGMDAESGRLSLDTRATASGGRFRGRMRAELEDFDMGNPLEERGTAPWRA